MARYIILLILFFLQGEEITYAELALPKHPLSMYQSHTLGRPARQQQEPTVYAQIMDISGKMVPAPPHLAHTLRRPIHMVPPPQTMMRMRPEDHEDVVPSADTPLINTSHRESTV
jgi:hypothetical protein